MKDRIIRHQKMLGLGDEDIKILLQLRDSRAIGDEYEI